MRFQVPQFIETEEKIIGPFTIKQFIFITIGGMLLFLIFFLVTPGWFVILAIPVIAITLSLALIKVAEMPLYLYLAHALSFAFNPKRYIYRPDQEEINHGPK
ncbi:MAG: hypothetical protein A3I24_00970 [Candidatus Harrisonbacteria bacterium RIFCSPLOWO2_02_FULL_41_13b]|uniref:PrgI family protein n=1 Tax=Candidatus Harrisonbacteria bacterium RIFCSPLOWO2_02_FULL_41_13b TaxID=1798409 RepID=A0A1G1ZT73_9BACT|nr:MAG: hypothetical protein A3I24_00970 [Candidatus Harrisonbacteria bacterium RIFCSPLOWO2_02_FULL_41_13b]